MKKKLSLLMTGLLFSHAAVSFPLSYAELSTNQDAPDFILPNSDGQSSELKDFLKDKKAVLLNFWATWCPSCKHEIPQLIELQTKYSDKSFSVLGIDVGESGKKVSAFKKHYSMNYPVQIDGNSEIAKKYGVVGLPVSVLIDSKGKVLGQYHEYSDQLASDVEKALS